ncbi:MAG: hypothetical protein RL610_666 [Pseudomonadota bacterium]
MAITWMAALICELSSTRFGIPLANYLGWATVSLLVLMAYPPLDQRQPPKGCPIPRTGPGYVLLGCGLYYGLLIFILGVTFWIKEPLQGMTGIMIYIPITILLILRLLGWLPPTSSKIFRSDPRLIR